MDFSKLDAEVQKEFALKHNFFEQIGYRPHKKQYLIHFSEIPWQAHVACWGRRSGKTMAAAMEAVWVLSKPGKHIWIAAPTYKLTKKVYREVWKLVIEQQVLGPASVCIVRKQNAPQAMVIETAWGSWLECVSCDNPVNLLGEGLDLLVVDEAARLNRLTFEESLEPTLAEANRDGKCLMISTPRGHNWFKDKWDFGDQMLRGWTSSHMKSEESPYVSDEYLARKRQEIDPVTYRQEYEASFEHHTGVVYPDFKALLYPHGQLWNDQTLEQLDMPHIPGNTGMHMRVIDTGLDNPTAVIWAQIMPRTNDIFLYQDYEERGVLVKDHAAQIHAQTMYGVTMDLIDPAANRTDDKSGQTTTQEYRYCGVFPTPAKNAKRPGHQAVTRYLRATLEPNPDHPRLFIHESMKRTIWCMQNYIWKPRADGSDGNRFDEALKKDDHLPDDIRYLCLFGPLYSMKNPYGQERERRPQPTAPVQQSTQRHGCSRVRPTAGFSL
ncbi:MAG: DEAD/DEAH box helicase [Planctomycetota bacterium]